jgi:hypothetical protein
MNEHSSVRTEFSLRATQYRWKRSKVNFRSLRASDGDSSESGLGRPFWIVGVLNVEVSRIGLKTTRLWFEFDPRHSPVSRNDNEEVVVFVVGNGRLQSAKAPNDVRNGVRVADYENDVIRVLAA